MGDTLGALLPLVLLALAFVVLIVLPMRTRSRQLAQTRQMQAALTVGAEVMTTSGLYGTIAALAEDTVDLEVSPGVTVRWARAAVAEVRTPAATSDADTAGPARADGETGPA